MGTRHLVPCLNSYEENIFLWPQSFTLNILKGKPSFDDNTILVSIRLRILIVRLNCNILYPQGEFLSIICSSLYMPKLSCDWGNETYLASSNFKNITCKIWLWAENIESQTLDLKWCNFIRRFLYPLKVFKIALFIGC